MPLPFRNAAELESGGAAAFLRMPTTTERDRWAALLLINAVGEPLEFVDAHAAAPSGPLWPAAQAARSTERALLRSLFETCVKAPVVLLAPADEVAAEILTEDIQPTIPVALVVLDAGEDVKWLGSEPSATSPARRLVDTLRRRGLSEEPFRRVERAMSGRRPEE